MNRSSFAVFVAVLLCVVPSLAALRAQHLPSPADPRLAGLKHALEDAEAPPLSSQQEEQFLAVLAQFHNLRQIQTREQGRALEAARRAYENAVLSGNNAAAQAQADVIASHIAATTRANLQTEANFKIQVLNLLTAAQKGLLSQRQGTAGLFRLLGSVGGPVFFGGALSRFAGPGQFEVPMGPW